MQNLIYFFKGRDMESLSIFIADTPITVAFISSTEIQNALPQLEMRRAASSETGKRRWSNRQSTR